jgi:predicted nucleic acid-binding protein
MQDYVMIELSADDFAWAFDNARDDDFEDALQLAVAIRTGCDTFVTFDKQLAKNYNNLPTLKVVLL